MNRINNLIFRMDSEFAKSPERSTEDSAGHDIFAHKDIKIQPFSTIDIELPFSIKNITDDYSIHLYLRSSFGIKKNIRLIKDNEVVENIKLSHNKRNQITLYNDNNNEFIIKKNEHFCQIIFTHKEDKNIPFVLEEVSDKERKKYPFIPKYSLDIQGVKGTYIIDNEIDLDNNEQIVIPIGIKVKVKKGTYIEGLISNDIKKDVILSNGTGIIDADYYNNEGNEGILFIALKNISGNPIHIPKGTRILDMLCKKYYVSDNENHQPIMNKRTGGIGHTNEGK